jgi:hypothetical protein
MVLLLQANSSTTAYLGSVQLTPPLAGTASQELFFSVANFTSSNATANITAPSSNETVLNNTDQIRLLLFALRFELLNGTNNTAAQRSQGKYHFPAGMLQSLADVSLAEPSQYKHTQPTAEMQLMERRVRAAEVAVGAKHMAASTWPALVAAPGALNHDSSRLPRAWQQLQHRYGWASHQGVFQSLYRPCVNTSPSVCAEVCA